ncbi:esterase B1-like [Colletes latitarsis]|uniref:esterase B1-like n=1 Tax=Colletes latitarsis TaxID=2605962 RepID=UPI004036707C
MRYSLFLAIAFLATAAKCRNLSQIVQTNKGPVQGVVLKTAFHQQSYSSFFAIPYAKPPVGELRFKAPIEADSWTNVRSATQESQMCPQLVNQSVVGDEDCLYLNVYTPVLNFNNNTEALKPVLVYIYGGAFQTGSDSKGTFGPDGFLEKDIVMVDMNYRLGVLGFLALGVPDAQGNQGLKDQNMALQWVQKNIARFGGDPNRVSLMGQSAGSASVTYHVLSPKSRGLFQQAISHSGSALCSWAYKTPTYALWNAYELGRRMNMSVHSTSELLTNLMNVNATDLVTFGAAMSTMSIPIPINIAFAPTSEVGNNVKDPFLTECPASYFESGNFNHVPVLMGYMAQETILFSTALDYKRQALQDKLQGLTSLLDPTGVNDVLLRTVNSIVNSTEWELIKASTLYYFKSPIDLMQRYFVKYNENKPVYYYRMSYSSQYNDHRRSDPNINGAAHGDDLPLLFLMDGYPTNPNTTYNKFCNKISTMWSNFIKYGNPTPPNSVQNGTYWTPSGPEGYQLDIGNDKFVMNDRLLTSNDEFVQKTYYYGLPAVTTCQNYPINPPVPVKPWNETLNAFQEGNVCPQLDLQSGVFMGNEDCLFLNVITPETQFEDEVNLKPVMVWIHGGGFLSGSGNLSLYGPDFFIEENIVFVSFNYRIGALGFLALNHPRATGNAGLKDQNLVLRWVQKNIDAFGGNPKQVTIFGQSAGAASVGFHTLSKKSKVKFNQVNTTKQVIKFLQNRAKYEESISGKTRNQLANLLGNDSKTTINKIVKIGTDFFFRIPIDLTQRMLAKRNENHSIYYYRLSYQSEYSMHRLYDNPLKGTAHLDDVGYIFNVKQLQAPTDPANSFNQFRKRMVTLWANFAKYGNPTPNNSSDVIWTDSRKSRSQLDINETFIMHDRLIDGRVENYEKGLYTALALVSACRHKPVDYKSIF